jgi:hypothetical protein
MFYIFVIGFLLGLRHALDADHIAAVASLITRSNSKSETVRTSIAWGLGHTVTLFLVCAIVLVMDIGFPDRVAHVAEFLVGLMLIALGADVVRRALHKKVHLHGHNHDKDGYHLHLHSHAATRNHDVAAHSHAHPKGLPARALMIGLMHGLAGSAALLLLAVTEQGDMLTALVYIALFGAGSTLGMVLLSLTIALPLRASAKMTKFGFKGFNTAIGAATVALGIFIVFETAPSIAGILGNG